MNFKVGDLVVFHDEFIKRLNGLKKGPYSIYMIADDENLYVDYECHERYYPIEVNETLFKLYKPLIVIKYKDADKIV